ncbi:MAG: DnaB-like helicase C-terminal domain-containing protein [Methylomicrobium sp.]|nr:DnaB-like helicase C-terminal domain-containing protein [Methylomicrobium sp.]
MAVRDEISNLEDIVVAILLRHPKLVLAEPLDISIFTRWKAVIHAMIKLTGHGIEPDIFTISDEVDDKTLIRTLAVLQNEMTGARENYAHYLKTLRAKVVDLTIFEKLREGMKSIAAGNPAAEVLGELVTDSLSLLSTSTERQYSFTAREMMQVVVDKLETILDESNDNTLGIKTGLSKLDSVLGALHPSDMCIVGARPAVGKTAFGVTVMLNAAKQGKRVGFISTEMSIDQIGFRVSSQASGINSKNFRRADFDDAEWTRLSAATVVLSEYQMRVCDKPVMRVSDVLMQARAWDLDGGVDLIIVDYLTRIKPDKAVGNQNLDVGEIATAMKNLARDLKIPVIVLAQLNRNTTNRTCTKPRMSDLRDSGIIEQEADSILLLHREESDTGEKHCSIIVDKNRHGECVEAMVEFDESIMRWHCDDADYEQF